MTTQRFFIRYLERVNGNLDTVCKEVTGASKAQIKAIYSSPERRILDITKL
jgi:hypothetical protein